MRIAGAARTAEVTSASSAQRWRSLESLPSYSWTSRRRVLTRCPDGNCGVWWPSVSRLDRPLSSLLTGMYTERRKNESVKRVSMVHKIFSIHFETPTSSFTELSILRPLSPNSLLRVNFFLKVLVK